MKCPSCGYDGDGWKYEGLQRLPSRDEEGKRITLVWETWTCPSCGSTHLFNAKEER
jgi:predicted RNA-binding Zn-ribbon protein involved in translation (DUF1610 family)